MTGAPRRTSSRVENVLGRGDGRRRHVTTLGDVAREGDDVALRYGPLLIRERDLL
jgi:hypothetical protein